MDRVGLSITAYDPVSGKLVGQVFGTAEIRLSRPWQAPEAAVREEARQLRKQTGHLDKPCVLATEVGVNLFLPPDPTATPGDVYYV